MSLGRCHRRPGVRRPRLHLPRGRGLRIGTGRPTDGRVASPTGGRFRSAMGSWGRSTSHAPWPAASGWTCASGPRRDKPEQAPVKSANFFGIGPGTAAQGLRWGQPPGEQSSGGQGTLEIGEGRRNGGGRDPSGELGFRDAPPYATAFTQVVTVSDSGGRQGRVTSKSSPNPAYGSRRSPERRRRPRSAPATVPAIPSVS